MNNSIDILLVYPPVNRLCDVAGNYFPLGLGYIAASTIKNGFTTKIYNAELETRDLPPSTNKRRIANHHLFVEALSDENHRVWTEFRKVLDDYRPKIIGFSTTSASIEACLIMAGEAKNRNIVTIFGGMHATILPEETARSEFVDYIIAGEGENNLSVLAEKIINNKKVTPIPGVGWIDNGAFNFAETAPLVENIDSFEFSDRDCIIYPDANKPYMGVMVTSRGCPYPCTFCAGENIHKRRVRYHSVERVIEEMRVLKDNYDVSYITFYDDFMISNRKRMIKICKAMIEADLDMTWGCFSRVDSVDEELLEIMVAAGCRYIGMGVESGSNTILKKIKKGYNREAALRGVKLAKESGVSVGMSIITGFPFETEDDIKQTISLVKELNIMTNVNTFTPYPGSALYHECVERGLISKQGVDWKKISQHSCFNNFIQDIEQDTFSLLLEELVDIADKTFSQPTTSLEPEETITHNYVYRTVRRLAGIVLPEKIKKYVRN